MALSPNFAEQQAKRKKPDCFGKYEKSKKCGFCWFGPNCKEYKPKPKAKPKKKVDD